MVIIVYVSFGNLYLEVMKSEFLNKCVIEKFIKLILGKVWSFLNSE